MSPSIDVTDETFESEVVQAPILTIADLWAEWCGPCKRLSPILDEIATEYAGRVKLVKLDVDENPDTPGRYGVMGIPTVLVFKGGELVETLVGFMPKDRLVGKLEPHLD